MIELVIAILVLAIVTVIALPIYNEVIKNNRLVTESNNIATALNMARSEAITRSIGISVCPSSNGTSCLTTATWGSGWILFTDADTEGKVDGSDAVLRVWPGTTGGDTLATSTLYSRFLPTGRANASATWVLKPANCKSGQQRSIELGAQGRMNVTHVACS